MNENCYDERLNKNRFSRFANSVGYQKNTKQSANALYYYHFINSQLITPCPQFTIHN